MRSNHNDRWAECAQCGVQFEVRDGARFHNAACFHASQKSTPSNFWKRADKQPGLDGCWLFTGAVSQTGYGKLGFRGDLWAAHRLAWTLTYGPIPDDLWVLHKCDVRPCIRPDHLFLGTVADNNQDMWDKGRHAPLNPPIRRGEQATGAKLTVADIAEIHRTYTAREANQSELAARYGVARTEISRALAGVRWAHVLPNGVRPKRAYVRRQKFADVPPHTGEPQ